MYETPIVIILVLTPAAVIYIATRVIVVEYYSEFDVMAHPQAPSLVRNY